jgi:hypothetical protein
MQKPRRVGLPTGAPQIRARWLRTAGSSPRGGITHLRGLQEGKGGEEDPESHSTETPGHNTGDRAGPTEPAQCCARRTSGVDRLWSPLVRAESGYPVRALPACSERGDDRGRGSEVRRQVPKVKTPPAKGDIPQIGLRRWPKVSNRLTMGRQAHMPATGDGLTRRGERQD